MKQVVQSLRDGRITVPEVPAPALREGGILVRSLHSIISSGTEGASAALSRESLVGKARRRPDLVRQVVQSVRREGLAATVAKVRDRLDTPKGPGYAVSGQVLAVGAGVEGLRVGDPVACAGEGYASHAEVVFVPRHLVARVPDGVDPEPAAFATLGAIALHGVRQLEVRLGETAVVIGLGLIGQIAWQLLVAGGVRAVGIDTAPGPVDRAHGLGLDCALLRSEPVEEAVDRLTGGLGADGVLITAGAASSDPVVLAGALCRDRGRVVILGSVRADIPRSPYYEKELEVRMSRSYGPGRYDALYEEKGLDYPAGYVRWTEGRNLEAFLELLAAGKVCVSELISHRFPVERAADAYALLIGRKRGDVTAIALRYPAAAAPGWPPVAAEGTPATRVAMGPALAPVSGAPRHDTIPTSTSPAGPREPAVGFVGAGRFARASLLPALGRVAGMRLTGVATGHPHTAEHVARKFGFAFAATRAEDVIRDEATHVVFIATRHDNHAALASTALAAGKAVYVEKPLALDAAALQEVMDAQRCSGAPLCVGFNRRFAPLTRRLLAELPAGVPRTIQIRVNAGPLPADHWLRDPAVGGGRLLGEGCHFVDLAGLLAGAPVTGVQGSGDTDDFSAIIQYADGSRASLLYTSTGGPGPGKERIEVFAGGTVAIMEDCQRLEIHLPGRRRPLRARARGKGHGELVAAFMEAVRDGRSPIPLEEIAASHRTLFALAEAVGRP